MVSRGRMKSSGDASTSPARAPGYRIEVAKLLETLPNLDKSQLLLRWRNHFGGRVPAHLPGWLLARVLAFRLQTQGFGDVSAATLRVVQRKAGDGACDVAPAPFSNRAPATREGADLRPGAILAREWRGKLERVAVLEAGFAWNGRTFGSLSQVAKAITGTSWNGHRFFGLRSGPATTGKPMASRRQKTEVSGPSVTQSVAAP
jgi:hypothetical protein